MAGGLGADRDPGRDRRHGDGGEQRDGPAQEKGPREPNVKFRRAQTPVATGAEMYRVAWNAGLGAPRYGDQRPMGFS